jgi:hypothetical protein
MLLPERCSTIPYPNLSRQLLPSSTRSLTTEQNRHKFTIIALKHMSSSNQDEAMALTTCLCVWASEDKAASYVIVPHYLECRLHDAGVLLDRTLRLGIPRKVVLRAGSNLLLRRLTSYLNTRQKERGQNDGQLPFPVHLLRLLKNVTFSWLCTLCWMFGKNEQNTAEFRVPQGLQNSNCLQSGDIATLSFLFA